MLNRFNLIRTLYKQNFSLLRYCSSGGHIVLMRGMDYDTTEEDIIGFFKPLGIVPKKIHLRRDGSGRTAGFTEVEFSTPNEALIALRKKNAFIGNRFIRLSIKPTDAANATDVKTFETQSLQSPPEVTPNADPTKKIVEPTERAGYFIRMKNAPWRLTDQDIFDFFYPVGVSPVSIQPVYDENGKRIGEFDVQFLAAEDLQKAAAKNNAYFRNKYVHLSVKQS